MRTLLISLSAIYTLDYSLRVAGLDIIGRMLHRAKDRGYITTMERIIGVAHIIAEIVLVCALILFWMTPPVIIVLGILAIYNLFGDILLGKMIPDGPKAKITNRIFFLCCAVIYSTMFAITLYKGR